MAWTALSYVFETLIASLMVVGGICWLVASSLLQGPDEAQAEASGEDQPFPVNPATLRTSKMIIGAVIGFGVLIFAHLIWRIVW